MRTELNRMNRLQKTMIDRINYVRMHLALLLHGQKYQQVDDNAHSGCRVPFCQFGRKLWRHIATCTQQTGSCAEPYCRVSREMLKHWEICSKSQKPCRMCTPLRTAKRKSSTNHQVPNCQTSRYLIRHYKECSSTDSCKKCQIPNSLKRKLYGPQNLTIKRRSALLRHSCCCRNKTCTNPMCVKMKRALTHTNICRAKLSDSIVCREIATFCLRHAISCTEKDCILSDVMSFENS